MASRQVTNAVLAEKIDGLHEAFNKFIEDDYKLTKAENIKNTEFRQKAYGVMAAFMAVGGFLAGIIVWVLNKVWK